MAARFGFGFAPDDRNGLKSALSRFPQAMLVEAGLLIEVEGRETYDRFRSRLMLPIEDMRSRVIAFGGRVLDGARTDAPKYLNSPDTPLFDKGATLYNLNRAAAAARKSGRLIVVEGYMDVIALAAVGIEECVAPMGTALTERQIELLWRQVETPILCFDGDAAGTRAAMRAATRALPMLKPAHSLGIVRLPSGMDPDDLVKRDGARAMEALLERPSGTARGAMWLQERDAEPLTTPEAKAGLKARLMAHVDTIEDRDYPRALPARTARSLLRISHSRSASPGSADRACHPRTRPHMVTAFAGHAGEQPVRADPTAARRIALRGNHRRPDPLALRNRASCGAAGAGRDDRCALRRAARLRRSTAGSLESDELCPPYYRKTRGFTGCRNRLITRGCGSVSSSTHASAEIREGRTASGDRSAGRTAGAGSGAGQCDRAPGTRPDG